ncbi:hypothetical protein PDUR_01275 [Paenibacillus durus]|uniref:Uncharacterized protein n=1 Tax=Paenibacillus durus TaxID=44251 RepID=A0A089HI63_PAEDU|nr:hypothetical protein PDUR_01275 [Paenibacillus durus]
MCCVPDKRAEKTEIQRICPLDEINRTYIEKEEGFLVDFLSKAKRPRQMTGKPFYYSWKLFACMHRIGSALPSDSVYRKYVRL